MMDSEVNIKVIGPNESLTQRNSHANPSNNKKALLQGIFCEYFPSIPTGILLNYKNVLQTKFKTTIKLAS